jgi:hypothetical protein
MEMTLPKHDDDSIDCVGLLKGGSIHYVSVAMPGLTLASANVEFAAGFNIGQRKTS